MNPTEFNYETIGFNVFMEKEGGLLGDPEMVIGSVDLGEEGTKEIEGYDLENLRISSWIKSRSYKPGVSGFMLDGKTGKITCKLLEVTGGTISYNKTSFSDSANGGYWVGSEGVYFGAAADATKFKFTIATGVIDFVGTHSGGTVGGQNVDNVGYVADPSADITPTGLTYSTSGISTGNDGSQSAYATLTWNAISTNTFDHYLIRYKKAALTYYTYVPANTNTITIEGLTPNISYNFGIASVNKYGAVSAYSADITQTTSSDSVAPATVTSDSATGGIQYVIVEWTHNTDSDLASYNIYRNTVNDSSAAVLIGNCRTNYFVDGGRTGGTTYYYWIKAVDTSGNVSSSFSIVQSAAPRNVENTDVTVGIAAEKILIDGVVYLTNWRKNGDLTKIDGGNISTGTVTLTQLNFTPVQDTDVIASINASAEGITIEADNLTIAAATTFTSGWAAASNAETDINVLNTTNAPAAANADVTQTIIDGGMITTGYITLNTAGHIKSGKASYADTAAGWWLGKDSTTPKFNIGSSTKYFKWDGTNITWKGANAELDASGNLIASSVTVSGALTTGAGSTINGGYIDSISAGIVTAGTMNAARINGGDINGVTITGVTVTGGTLQTSTSGKRIVITSDEVSMYNSDGTLSGKMYGVGTGVQGGPWIFLSAKTYIENHCLVYGDLSLRGTSTRRINLNDAAASLTWIQATAATQIQVNRTFIPSGTCDLGISGNAWNNLFVNGYSVFGSYIRPSASNTKDLGTSSFKWRHLYLDQNIYMDSGQNIYWSGTSYYLKHDGNFVFNDDVQPSITNSKRLGYTDKKWHTVHRVNEQGCHLPTSNSAIGTIKKLKKPKIESGKDFHYDKRHYFKTADFPDEMKVFDEGSKEPDKMEIELTRVQGVTLNAVREMVEEIDLLKNRLKLMEKKFI